MGIEGQMYMGGFAAVVVGLTFPELPKVVFKLITPYDVGCKYACGNDLGTAADAGEGILWTQRSCSVYDAQLYRHLPYGFFRT